jgi:putative hydrolase of the HAD superfamily
VTIRAVFFDAGFTLIHPSRPIADIYVEAARVVSTRHCDSTLRGVFHQTWASGTRNIRDDHRSSDALERARWHQFTRRIAESVPNLLDHHEAWLEQLTLRFDRRDGWQLAPDAPELLRDLRARGLKVAIVSNWHGGLGRLLDDLGITELVDFVVVSAEVGFRKPHPEIFQHALRRSGVEPGAALHVGDTWAEDVVGAQAVGITPIHIAEPAAHRPGEGHRSIATLSEIRKLIEPKSGSFNGL